MAVGSRKNFIGCELWDKFLTENIPAPAGSLVTSLKTKATYLRLLNKGSVIRVQSNAGLDS